MYWVSKVSSNLRTALDGLFGVRPHQLTGRSARRGCTCALSAKYRVVARGAGDCLAANRPGHSGRPNGAVRRDRQTLVLKSLLKETTRSAPTSGHSFHAFAKCASFRPHSVWFARREVVIAAKAGRWFPECTASAWLLGD